MRRIFIALIVLLTLAFSACKESVWQPGMPIRKERIKIGVVHITNPFVENTGYSYSHQLGINDMKQKIGLYDSQFIYKTHIVDSETELIESTMRDLIANGVNIIIATSWGYMETCEKLSKEFPLVIFVHATGYKYNENNFTNYFGKVYQARYLSGIVAGIKTTTNKIGYVAALGKENSEVTGGINAFAMGVERINPQAKVYVKITHSWFDPVGETAASKQLISLGCDVIAQHCDTANPQKEAQKAGVFGIGYNTDMSEDAKDAVLTSVIWNWGVYYTELVQSVIDGTFKTTPWYGSLSDGVVALSPLGGNTVWRPETIQFLKREREKLESEELFIFKGVIKTNDGTSIGNEDEVFTEDEIRNSINWYYHNINQL